MPPICSGRTAADRKKRQDVRSRLICTRICYFILIMATRMTMNLRRSWEQIICPPPSSFREARHYFVNKLSNICVLSAGVLRTRKLLQIFRKDCPLATHNMFHYNIESLQSQMSFTIVFGTEWRSQVWSQAARNSFAYSQVPNYFSR